MSEMLVVMVHPLQLFNKFPLSVVWSAWIRKRLVGVNGLSLQILVVSRERCDRLADEVKELVSQREQINKRLADLRAQQTAIGDRIHKLKHPRSQARSLTRATSNIRQRTWYARKKATAPHNETLVESPVHSSVQPMVSIPPLAMNAQCNTLDAYLLLSSQQLMPHILHPACDVVENTGTTGTDSGVIVTSDPKRTG